MQLPTILMLVCDTYRTGLNTSRFVVTLRSVRATERVLNGNQNPKLVIQQHKDVHTVP